MDNSSIAEIVNDGRPTGYVCDCHMSLFESVLIFIMTVALWEIFKMAYRHLFGAKLYKQSEDKSNGDKIE